MRALQNPTKFFYVVRQVSSHQTAENSEEYIVALGPETRGIKFNEWLQSQSQFPFLVTKCVSMLRVERQNHYE